MSSSFGRISGHDSVDIWYKRKYSLYQKLARLYQKWGSHYTKLIGCKKNIDLEAEISHKIQYVYVFNPFWPGGHWSLYSLGEGQFDPHFLTAPGGLMGHISFNFKHYTIILFKERIKDYPEKKWANILKIWQNIAIFVGQKIFGKFLRISFFKLEIIVTRPFLKISSSSFFLTSQFLEYKKILHWKNGVIGSDGGSFLGGPSSLRGQRGGTPLQPLKGGGPPKSDPPSLPITPFF